MELIIRQITTQDRACFPDGIELLNRTQGRDLFASHYLDERTNDPLSYVVGAFHGELLMGLGVAQILHHFEYYLPFDPHIVSELEHKIVGSFSTLCMHESLQGKGIGQKISVERMKWLKSHHCEVVLGISWVSGLAHTSNRVFEKFGFKPVKQLDDFFYNPSLKNPFECPTCGNPPCTCPAILYRLDIK
ncbi:MAG: GNAT family N-acetyltransferase [Bacteriovoracaceae bacterium]